MDWALVGDVGGTHARFGLIGPEADAPLHEPRTYACAEHDSLEAILVAYLAELGERAGRPREIAVAVAGPVEDEAASFTNLPWTVSAAALRAAGFDRAEVLNDFEALALGAPRLTAADLAPIGEPLPGAAGTLAVLGPGTGFGAAALCVDKAGAAVLVTEGGHIAWAPTDEVEVEVWRILARRFGRVSVERVLSGPGLVNLYHALCEVRGEPAAAQLPAEVVAMARAGDATCHDAVARFCAALGAVAGDFALAYGARGGVYLAGGVAAQLLPELRGGGFRTAFEAKGRLSSFVTPIATAVITHPYLALLGAAESLRRPA